VDGAAGWRCGQRWWLCVRAAGWSSLLFVVAACDGCRSVGCLWKVGRWRRGKQFCGVLVLGRGKGWSVERGSGGLRGLEKEGLRGDGRGRAADSDFFWPRGCERLLGKGEEDGATVLLLLGLSRYGWLLEGKCNGWEGENRRGKKMEGWGRRLQEKGEREGGRCLLWKELLLGPGFSFFVFFSSVSKLLHPLFVCVKGYYL